MAATHPIPLVVLLRAPRLGQVKSRLAAEIGEKAALDCYRHLLDRLSGRLAGVADVELRVTPDDGLGEVAYWLRPEWRTSPQGGGDLGDRMLRSISAHTDTGAPGCVVIGSDCPDLTAADVAAAREALGACDLVLGPASDGGYWLIGARTPCPELFSGMPWGTDRVLAETLERARARGLEVSLLRTLDDIDTASDWRRYQALSRNH